MEQESISVRVRNTFIDVYDGNGPTILEHRLIRSASDGSLSKSSTSEGNKFTFWIPSMTSSSTSSSKPSGRSSRPQTKEEHNVIVSASGASSTLTPISLSQPSYAQSAPSVPLWSAGGAARPEDLAALLAFTENGRSAPSAPVSLAARSEQHLSAQFPTFQGQPALVSAAVASSHQPTEDNIISAMMLLRAGEAELMQNFQATMWQQEQLNAQVQVPFEPDENSRPVQMTKQGKPRTGIASAGSAKHPDRCSPCLFYFKRICNKGTSCTYCHYIHEGQKNVRIRPAKKIPKAESAARDTEAQA